MQNASLGGATSADGAREWGRASSVCASPGLARIAKMRWLTWLSQVTYLNSVVMPDDEESEDSDAATDNDAGGVSSENDTGGSQS